MKEKLVSLSRAAARRVAPVTVPLLLAGHAMAQTEPATADASITQAKDTILGLVATAGAGMVAVALAFVGWKVGSRLVSKLGSSAR